MWRDETVDWLYIEVNVHNFSSSVRVTAICIDFFWHGEKNAGMLHVVS
jgi:hypothetical protein